MLLVFGVLPRTPISPLPLSAQRERMTAAVTARTEMRTAVAKTRVASALNTSVPAAAGRILFPSQKVLTYRETPVDEWVGPHTVVTQQDKVFWLADDGHLKQFSIGKLKPYVAPPANASALSPTPTPVAQSATSASVGAPAAAVPSPSTTAAPSTPTVDSDLGRLLDSVILRDFGSPSSHRDCHAPQRAPAVIGLNKVISPGDPRLNATRFRYAALEEVAGVRDRCAFHVISTTGVPA